MRVVSSRKYPKWRHAPFRFWIEECGGEGDCMFHAVAVGIGRMTNQRYSMQQVRQLLSTSLTTDNFTAFLDCTRHDIDQGGKMAQLQTIITNQPAREPEMLGIVRKVIEAPGHAFQGTDTCLEWLTTHVPLFRQIGFMIFSSYGPDFTVVINPKAENFLLLFNTPNNHWQLGSLESDNRRYSAISQKSSHQVQSILSANQLQAFPGVSASDQLEATVLNVRAASAGSEVSLITGVDFVPLLNAQMLVRKTPIVSSTVSDEQLRLPLPSSFSWLHSDEVMDRIETLHGVTITRKAARQLLSPVFDQRACGSCWSIAASQMLADRLAVRLSDTNQAFSATQMLTCVNRDFNIRFVSMGCLGGDPFEALVFAETKPLVQGEDYSWCTDSTKCTHNCQLVSAEEEDNVECRPMEVQDLLPTCPTTVPPGTNVVEPGSVQYMTTQNKNLEQTRDAIRQEIYFNGPVVATYMVYMDHVLYDQWEKTNFIYIHGAYDSKDPSSGLPAKGVKLGGHAVTVVGYGSRKVEGYGEVPYWVVRNSWSIHWGAQGYFRLAMSDADKEINHDIAFDRALQGMGGILIADINKAAVRASSALPTSDATAAAGAECIPEKLQVPSWIFVVLAFLLVVALLVMFGLHLGKKL